MSKLGSNMELNSYSQQDARGREDTKLNWNKEPVKLILNDNEVLTAGDMIKICDGENGVCACSVGTSETRQEDVIYGFIPLARIDNKYINGNMSTICKRGCVMEMVGGEDIKGGEVVYYNNTETATSGYGRFKNIDYTKFTTISSGTLEIKIDGVLKSYSSLDFSSVASIDNVVSVLSTAMSSDADVVKDNNDILIKSKTTGHNSTIELNDGVVKTALNTNGEEYINGAEAGENQGKIYMNNGGNGFIKCGIAKERGSLNKLFRVEIL